MFERDAVLAHEAQTYSVGKIDLYKRGCFILEAKQGSGPDTPKTGSARRGTPGWNIARRFPRCNTAGLTYGTQSNEKPPGVIPDGFSFARLLARADLLSLKKTLLVYREEGSPDSVPYW